MEERISWPSPQLPAEHILMTKVQTDMVNEDMTWSLVPLGDLIADL
jgi:hypothetical protein